MHVHCATATVIVENILFYKNDPLGQTHNPTSSYHYYLETFVSFCDILKRGDGRTDRNMCENNDHYRPELWSAD